jgi:hypothetical protein
MYGCFFNIFEFLNALVNVFSLRTHMSLGANYLRHTQLY